MTSSAMRVRPSFRKFALPALPPFKVMAALIVTCFLFGGAARGDVMSIVFLRPLCMVALAIGCWSLKWDHLGRYKPLAILLAATMTLIVLHMIPLPPAIWHALPGRDLVAAVDRQAGLGEVWRPLSLSPLETRNALFSMIIPTAAFVLGVQLTGPALHRLVFFILAMVTVSALIGMLQILGPPNAPLYFYRITNNGSAVGLFSNRNHEAVLLAATFPLLAVLVRSRTGTKVLGRWTLWLATAMTGLLLPLLLVTGSRTGVIAAGITGILSVVLYFTSGEERLSRGTVLTKRRIQIAAGAGVVGLVGVTIALSRAEAVRRLFAADSAEDLRFQVWPLIARMAQNYLPWGSGAGSFVEIYRIGEPDRLLEPSYLNHAHNDFLEVFLTTGVPGLLLVAAGLLLFAVDAWRAWRADGRLETVLFARGASVVIAALVISSVTDYPLRTPSLACFFVIAWLWLHASSRDEQRATQGVDPNVSDG
jgi:O-antigen ligase